MPRGVIDRRLFNMVEQISVVTQQQGFNHPSNNVLINNYTAPTGRIVLIRNLHLTLVRNIASAVVADSAVFTAVRVVDGISARVLIAAMISNVVGTAMYVSTTDPIILPSVVAGDAVFEIRYTCADATGQVGCFYTYTVELLAARTPIIA